MPVDLSDYVDVPERIALFRDRYPAGSLQADVIAWPSETFPGIAVKAYAFRGPEDALPGVGLAFEPFPGKTPYTRDSELQNAETSAWGRAIVAALVADTKRGVASREEVRNRQASPAPVGEGEAPAGVGAEAPGGTQTPLPEESPRVQPNLDAMGAQELAAYASSIGLTPAKAKAIGKGLGVVFDADGWRAVLAKFQGAA